MNKKKNVVFWYIVEDVVKLLFLITGLGAFIAYHTELFAWGAGYPAAGHQPFLKLGIGFLVVGGLMQAIRNLRRGTTVNRILEWAVLILLLVLGTVYLVLHVLEAGGRYKPKLIASALALGGAGLMIALQKMQGKPIHPIGRIFVFGISLTGFPVTAYLLSSTVQWALDQEAPFPFSDSSPLLYFVMISSCVPGLLLALLDASETRKQESGTAGE